MPDEKSTLLDVSTKAPAPDSVRDQEVAVHHIRAVGGGAAGLELVTRLGDTLGRHGRARITLIKKGRTHLWQSCNLPRVIPKIDIWRAANLMLKRYGDKALEESAARGEDLAAQDDYSGEAVWRRITDAVRQLANQTPAGPLH